VIHMHNMLIVAGTLVWSYTPTCTFSVGGRAAICCLILCWIADRASYDTNVIVVRSNTGTIKTLINVCQKHLQFNISTNVMQQLNTIDMSNTANIKQ